MDQEAYEKGHHENIIVCFLLFPGEMVACMKFISSNINDSLFTVSQTVLKNALTVVFKQDTLRDVIFIYFSKYLVGSLQKKQHENIIRFTILVTRENIFLEIRI